ncbi:MAG: 3-phosphoshikimate 1-carboxyvinyltransferase [Planctomycetota bacterium]|jgi:3-phosphoshikimate 1-carboxyvinyltransferase
MKVIVHKSRLGGEVIIPGSKSHTIRAVAIGSLASGASTISSPLVSGDTTSAVSCYRSMGAEIDISDPKLWRITGTNGQISPADDIVDVGNSGTTLRVALGSAALAPVGKVMSFTGDDQIQSRSIGPLIQSLNDLGAKCVSLRNNQKAPVEVMGRLSGGKTSIAATTSQYLSSLLLCTPLAENDSEIEVSLLNEPGYVQITLDWLDKQGIKYENDRLKKVVVKGGQGYTAFDVTIPADFSSATFFLCGACLCGEEVTLRGLDFSDSQPDKAVVDYLTAMGADITVEGDSVKVRSCELQGVEIDMNATPDALPAMAVTGALAKGTTSLVNVPHARGKETDRIKCMAEELKKMGISVEELPDGLIIEGGSPVACDFDGRGDHRIVMALALAGLVIDGPCTIKKAEAMNVTFPDYVGLMRSIGADMQIN